MQRLVSPLILAAALSCGLALALPGIAAAQTASTEAASVGLPAPGANFEYAVRAGDTMIGIARRFLNGGEKRDIQQALWKHNQLKDKDSIHIGQVIRIPVNWLREVDTGIELAHVEGDVKSKGQPLKPGAKIAPGDDFRTGKDGYVTIRLADGSTLALLPGSDMQIEDKRVSPLKPAADAQFLLKSGRIEATVPKRSGSGARFEVRTPIAVAAVRGTKFRVLTDSEIGRLTTEVLEGDVQVSDAGNLGSVAVPEGFGTRVIAGSAPAAPRALLPAPRLWTGIRLSLRKPVRFNFTSLAGAEKYRVVVARHADFSDVILETVLETNEIVLPELENGPYFLKVRGIDDIGLEGRDATADFVLALEQTPDTTPTPSPAKPKSP